MRIHKKETYIEREFFYLLYAKLFTINCYTSEFNMTKNEEEIKKEIRVENKRTPIW